jgi:hypothetical protein
LIYIWFLSLVDLGWIVQFSPPDVVMMWDSCSLQTMSSGSFFFSWCIGKSPSRFCFTNLQQGVWILFPTCGFFCCPPLWVFLSVNLNVPRKQQASDSHRRVEVVAGGLCLAGAFSDLRHGPLLIMLLAAFLKFDGASILWVSALSFLLDTLLHSSTKGAV